MFTLVSYGYQWRPFNYSEFTCDSEDDVKLLPTTKDKACSLGSKAYVPSTGHTYVLVSGDKWIIDECADGGGGGGDDPSPEDVEPIDDGTIEHLFD